MNSESDLYGDEKYMERWNWLVVNRVIENETPYDLNAADRLLYINAYTYAVRTKVDVWEKGSNFWWSPLLTESRAIQDGYFRGMQTADQIEITFSETGTFPDRLTNR